MHRPRSGWTRAGRSELALAIGVYEVLERGALLAPLGEKS